MCASAFCENELNLSLGGLILVAALRPRLERRGDDVPLDKEEKEQSPAVLAHQAGPTHLYKQWQQGLGLYHSVPVGQVHCHTLLGITLSYP